MDDQLRQRLAELGEIAAALDPQASEDEVGRDRTEAYREGIRFAVAFIEDDGPDSDAPGPDTKPLGTEGPNPQRGNESGRTAEAPIIPPPRTE